MHLVLTDETNTDPDKSTFFLVGGIALPWRNAFTLHQEIEEIRTAFGYYPTDSFKYAKADKPRQVDDQAFNNAKSAALDLFAKYGVAIFLYACHHLIAASRSAEEKFQWGNNALLWLVQNFLIETRSFAWVVQDRHPVTGEFDYYKRRFRESQPSNKNSSHKLDRIVGYGSTCDGASHLTSLVDIALGSYRFCLNHSDKDIVNGLLMPKLLPATWGFPRPMDKGLGIFPRKLYKKECIADYDALRTHISAYCKA